VIPVYSVKSYCVLKMSENKEKIQYILKFYYKKGKNIILIYYIMYIVINIL